MLGRLGANRCRGHRAERNARADDAAAARRKMRGKRYQRTTLRPDARDLAITERFRACRALAGAREHERAGLAVAPAEELRGRERARAIAALHRNGRPE